MKVTVMGPNGMEEVEINSRADLMRLLGGGSEPSPEELLYEAAEATAEAHQGEFNLQNWHSDPMFWDLFVTDHPETGPCCEDATCPIHQGITQARQRAQS